MKEPPVLAALALAASAQAGCGQDLHRRRHHWKSFDEKTKRSTTIAPKEGKATKVTLTPETKGADGCQDLVGKAVTVEVSVHAKGKASPSPPPGNPLRDPPNRAACERAALFVARSAGERQRGRMTPAPIERLGPDGRRSAGRTFPRPPKRFGSPATATGRRRTPSRRTTTHAARCLDPRQPAAPDRGRRGQRSAIGSPKPDDPRGSRMKPTPLWEEIAVVALK
jgi:hypothetical protein